MGKFGRSWALAKSSWAVLRADKELLLLPVISGITTLLVMASFAVPIFLTGRTDTTTIVSSQGPGAATTVSHGQSFQFSPLGYGLIFLAYVALAYVTIFFNTALISAADERMRGGDPTLGSALKGATSRAGAILPWAIVSATVSMVLRALEQRAGLLGKFVIGLVGIAWSLVTFLVLPILVLEGVGVGTAIKRSTELFKRTWGENVIANAAMGLLAMIAMLIAVPVVAVAFASGLTVAIVAAVAVAVVWIIGVSIVLSALGVVYQVALYRFATDGVAPAAFATADLGGAFRPKRR